MCISVAGTESSVPCIPLGTAPWDKRSQSRVKPLLEGHSSGWTRPGFGLVKADLFPELHSPGKKITGAVKGRGKHELTCWASEGEATSYPRAGFRARGSSEGWDVTKPTKIKKKGNPGSCAFGCGLAEQSRPLSASCGEGRTDRRHTRMERALHLDRSIPGPVPQQYKHSPSSGFSHMETPVQLYFTSPGLTSAACYGLKVYS